MAVDDVWAGIMVVSVAGRLLLILGVVNALRYRSILLVTDHYIVKLGNFGLTGLSVKQLIHGVILVFMLFLGFLLLVIVINRP